MQTMYNGQTQSNAQLQCAETPVATVALPARWESRCRAGKVGNSRQGRTVKHNTFFSAWLCQAALAALLGFASSARAATNTWGNTATNWNDPANWVGSQQPGTNDTAVFTNTTPAFQPNITASTTISNLQFKTGGWTLSSDSPTTTLTLMGRSSSPQAILNNGTNTISAPLIFGGNGAQYIRNNSSAPVGPLTITGNITKSDSGDLQFSAGSGISVSGNINANGKVVSLANSLPLSGSNSAGSWDLGGGGFRLNSAGALGSSGAINWSSAGASILFFTASNTTDYSSRFTVSAGQNYRVAVASGQTVTFASALAGSGTGSGLVVGHNSTSGEGTLILANSNSSFPGGVTLWNGNLSVAGIGNAGHNSYLGTNGIINFGQTTYAGTLIYTGAGETSDKVINIAGTTGGGTIQADNASGVLKFTNAITAATGVGATRTLTLQGTGSGEMAGAIVDGSSTNTTLLTKAGTGLWRLSGSNTLNGAIALNAGTLCVTKYLGTNTVTAADGTTFEIRSDQNVELPNAYDTMAASGVATVFVGRAVGGTGSNGTHSLGALKLSTRPLVINGEYGYGLSFGSTVLQYSPVISNAAPGLVSLGDVSYMFSSSDRTPKFQGSGNTRMGAFTNTTAWALTLQKDGTGQLTLNGPGNCNAVTLNAGSLLAGDSGALGTAKVSMVSGILRAGTECTVTNAITYTKGGFGGNGTITANGVTINTKTNGILDPGNATNLVGKVTLSSGILFTNSNCQYIWQLRTLSDQNPGVDYDQVSVGAGSSFTNSTVVLDLSLLPAADQPSADPLKAFWRRSRTWTLLDGATNWPRYLTGAYTNGFNLSSNTLTWTAPLYVGTTFSFR